MSEIDWFARPVKTPINPFELNNEGKGYALVLRYAGCNLKCPLCYAWKYAWNIKNGHPYDIEKSIVALENLSEYIEKKEESTKKRKKIVWIRIQGGEPCLNTRRTMNTVTFAARALMEVHKSGLNYFENTRAIIQTNGIVFSRLNKNEINTLKTHLLKLLNTLENGKVVFEVSFKSPCNKITMSEQITGFRILIDDIMIPLSEGGLENLAVYPVAGLGPSIDQHNEWIIPIESSFLPDEIPLFHPLSWAEEFRTTIRHFIEEIVPVFSHYKDFRKNPLTDGGTKLAIEEFEPTKFQLSWISGYAGNYEKFNVQVPPISELLRRLSEEYNRQWLALFKRNARWLKILETMPVSRNPEKLLELVREMRDVFYPSHPIGHYPYL